MRLFIFSSCLLLALTGCKPFWDPTFMPSGYAYHQKEYKSPPGPEASPIGYEYSNQKNNEVLEGWRFAIRDLLLRAKANGLNFSDPVYLSTDLNAGAFQSAYDSTLREGLRAYGFTIASSPEQAAHLFYSAYEASENGQPESVDPYNKDDAHHPHKDGDFLPPSGKLDLVLANVENGFMMKKVKSTYEVPLYGFKPAGYAPLHERPYDPEAHQPGAHQNVIEENGQGYND